MTFYNQYIFIASSSEILIYDSSFHFIDRLQLLTQHHRKGSSIVCTNDQLALRIKRDFPNYKVRASIINNITTIHEIEKSFDIREKIFFDVKKLSEMGFTRFKLVPILIG